MSAPCSHWLLKTAHKYNHKQRVTQYSVGLHRSPSSQGLYPQSSGQFPGCGPAWSSQWPRDVDTCILRIHVHLAAMTKSEEAGLFVAGLIYAILMRTNKLESNMSGATMTVRYRFFMCN